jgi:HD superfamily phosphohydrolase
MKIIDRVHGEQEITEPVIRELIEGPTMQRLKAIDQAGYFEPFFPGFSHSRFEHSVGVYLLLRKYQAPLEEQIAGLIHDVSHTAFSHCIDYLLNADSPHKQDHQDNIFENFVRKSEIPDILKKYNINLEYVLDDKNFPLKEKDLPDLCADRIDYSLRTARVLNDFSITEVNEILSHLIAEKGDWIFTDQPYARKFSELFMLMNTKYFASLQSAVMFQTVSDYLRHALEHSHIEKSDIFTTDRYVLEKIAPHQASDPILLHLFDRMNNKITYTNDPSNFQSKVVCKARIVDPLFQDGDTVKRLSESDSGWKIILERELQPKEYFLRFGE